MPEQKKQITLTLERSQDKVKLVLRVPKEVEDYYKAISDGETQRSNVWFLESESDNPIGAQFYKLTDKTAKIADSLSRYYPCFDNFGAELLDGERINLAPLRTVGASSEKGVVIYSNRFDSVNMIDFEAYIKRLGALTKMLWLDYIGSKQVKAVISFEL